MISPYIIPGLMDKRKIVNSSEIYMDRIVDVLVSGTRVDKELLVSYKKPRYISDIRMVAMWIIRKNTNTSFSQIGRFFNKNHSTVIKAIDTVNSRIDCKDYNIMAILDRVKDEI